MTQMIRNYLPQTAIALGLALSLVSVGCSDEDPVETNTISDIAGANPNFTTLAAALERTGLDQALAADGSFTVFAPTDEAFARLPAGLLEQLDNETLSQILLYHVVDSEVPASAVVGIDNAVSMQGGGIAISAATGDVMLNARTKVTTTDVFADNGVIHIIDSVMLPPGIEFPGTLVDLALAYPAFDTLVGAVAAAELVDALKGTNDGAGLTVFAPTNKAFADLGVDLGTLSTSDLTNILLYHVVGDTVSASEVVGLTSAPTLLGQEIAIAASSSGVMLNGSVQVIATDVFASNGVLHIISGVLIPE